MKIGTLLLLAAATVAATTLAQQAPRPPIDRLALLRDVQLTSPTTNQTLVYNAVTGKFSNGTLTIGSLQDVSDPTKQLFIDISAFTPGVPRTLVPAASANSVTVIPSSQGTASLGAVSSIPTGIGANGAVTYGYPAFVVLSAKSQTVATAGSPLDTCSISVPAGITRYRLVGSSPANSLCTIVTETQAGTPAAASFQLQTASGGAGTTLLVATNPSNGANTSVGWQPGSSGPVVTAASLFVRQTINSANAATASFYVVIEPLP